MLEHQDAIGRRDGNGTTGPPLANDHRHQWHTERQAAVDRSGDGLGLSTLLGADAGIGASRVDQRDHRQVEALGHLHQANRLAVALGARHAEVVPDAALGVVALLMTDEHNAAPTKRAEAADDRRVLGEVAVAG